MPEAVTAELTRLCGRLHQRDDGLRWSATDSWHITLQFLGSADDAQFACLQTQLAEVHASPVSVRLGSVNVFERARAFVVDVVLTELLIKLQQRVVAATTQCGFIPEDRPYHPHITLARAKSDARRHLKELKARIQTTPSFSSFIAKEFLLYESHLGPGGSKYEVQGRFSFSESAEPKPPAMNQVDH